MRRIIPDRVTAAGALRKLVVHAGDRTYVSRAYRRSGTRRWPATR